MNPTPLSDIPESLVEFNRARYKNELAQGIFDLMQTQKISRTQLANLLGIEKSRVTHMLSGDRNLQADTLADVLLVLGRTPHLTLGADFDAIRFPVDESKAERPDSTGNLPLPSDETASVEAPDR